MSGDGDGRSTRLDEGALEAALRPEAQNATGYGVEAGREDERRCPGPFDYSLVLAQQVECRHPHLGCNPLDGPQGEVALAAFDTAHVCPVHANYLGEGLLTETTLFAEGGDVAAKRQLQVSFHLDFDAVVSLLIDLQTDE